MSEPFLGEIRMFAGTFAPRGWAFCDGQILPISSNSALFALLGTTYGGDGRTTFALPDLSGRAPMHPGNGPGLTFRTLGQKGGTETVTLNVSELPTHTHQMSAINATGNSDVPDNNSLAQAGYQADSTTNLVNMHAVAITNTGGGQGHDNMAPSLGINFIIALEGVFPSRS
jgi:microcystin-dependent protein